MQRLTLADTDMRLETQLAEVFQKHLDFSHHCCIFTLAMLSELRFSRGGAGISLDSLSSREALSIASASDMQSFTCFGWGCFSIAGLRAQSEVYRGSSRDFTKP
jgi:hypothetical protein